MKIILPLIAALMLGACSTQTQEPVQTCKLVYRYGKDFSKSPEYAIILHLGKNWRISLKQAHCVYFDGSYYYICRGDTPLQSDKEIKRQALFVFTKAEADKIIKGMALTES